MTSRERLATVLAGDIPDCVPVAPDFSNMIPARLTGKPFWDLYLYNDPPIWEAYIECAKRFNIDSLMDGYFPLTFPDPDYSGPAWERFIVYHDDGRIVTQLSCKENGRRVWHPRVDVYYRADPPTGGVDPAKIRLPAEPERWEPLEGVKSLDLGPEGFRRVKEMLGDQGLFGAYVTYSCVLGGPDDIYRYYDDPAHYERLAEDRMVSAEERFRQIMAMEVRPDFLAVGGSGTLVWQTVGMFRKLALPAVKRVIDLATEAGLPTHIHSCGPERELVRIMAEETNLTVIDPLETPPMGDCDLRDLKRNWGDKIVLKGNLHTTEVMLRGTTNDVARAARAAIDAAAEGGGFILSTGDQCGRDTPDENLYTLIETARTYGAYR